MTESPPPTSDRLPISQRAERPTISLLHLPFELQLHITSDLPWPDLFALKHTHPHFYHSMPTTVGQRVDWLVRISCGPCSLGWPQSQVNMATDADFCRSYEIRRSLLLRRWHLDCRSDGRYCLLAQGQDCPPPTHLVPKGLRARMEVKTNFWQKMGKVSLVAVYLWSAMGLLMAVLAAWLVNHFRATLVC